MVRWTLYVDGRAEDTTTEPSESYRLYFKGRRLQALGYRVRLVRRARTNSRTDCL